MDMLIFVVSLYHDFLPAGQGWKVEFAQEILLPLFSLMDKPYAYARKNYYQENLMADIEKQVNGECVINWLDSTPIGVQLLDDDDFEQASKLGFHKYSNALL